MAGIANGLAAYHPNAVLPLFSTFFILFFYAAPYVKMAALQRLRVIGAATHDNIEIGEDGSTRQPVGLASLFRAIPNPNLFRPSDEEEVMGVWSCALPEECQHTPANFSLSRQPVPLLNFQ